MLPRESFERPGMINPSGRHWSSNEDNGVREYFRLLFSPDHWIMRGGRQLHLMRRITSPWRTLPDFIIIGAQKSGTTSLYNYMLQHPYIIGAATKEPDYFDHYYWRGILWYRSHFASRAFQCYQRFCTGQRLLVGEASTNYLWHPHAPRRIAKCLPDVRLVVLLRNPIDRAYSNYYMTCRKGRETLPFSEAVAQEPQRIRGEMDKMRKNPGYYSLGFRHFAYLAKGHYAEQLENWFQWIPRKQFLIIKSEDFYKDIPGSLARIWSFLGVLPVSWRNFPVYGKREYPQMDADMRAFLEKHFRQPNARLSNLLGMSFLW